MTFCKAMTNNIRLDVDDQQMIYKPCCDIKNFPKYININDYLNSSYLANLVNADSFPANCSSCLLQEQQGQVSLRKHFDNKFNNTLSIEQLEIMPNNTCNLKCFMCGPAYSSSFAQEYSALGWIQPFKHSDISEDAIDLINNLDNLKSISIIGGEFFLAKKNIDIMKAALVKGIKDFRAVTNCTIIHDEQLELLKQFESLSLQISLDGVKDSYELMRYPSKWETIEANVKRVIKVIPRANINFQSVIQPLNVLNIDQMLQFTNPLIIPHRLKNLVDPNWLSWAILMDHEKEMVINYLKSIRSLPNKQLIEISKFIETIDQFEYNPKLRKEFVYRMKQILNIRKLDYKIIDKHFLLKDLMNDV